MIEFPSLVVPSLDVFFSDVQSQYNEEVALAQEEAEYEEKVESVRCSMVANGAATKLGDIRAANATDVPIGKTTPENDQEEYEPDAEDEDVDNAEEEGEGEIEQ